jgi:hypothetical protein
MRWRIDIGLLADNVFYREKTFLRQLFFQKAVHPADAWRIGSRA